MLRGRAAGALLAANATFSFDLGTFLGPGIAAAAAGWAAYHFGYLDYRLRRERERLTRRYIDEGLDVYEAELTTDLNQTMNCLYMAQDWLGGGATEPPSAYLSRLPTESRAIGSVALMRTKDLFQNDELSKALLPALQEPAERLNRLRYTQEYVYSGEWRRQTSR